ncbi:hypothetical protein [Vineibacter terrae]|uniref:hypothetical protein n=1 Tax=Vineibacter terrae TaxID=2586908 RepID=UPI002E332C63|nr:hypothetical protein [Vineibacter terrae]HEX2892181.1 hypothetical protein [Vineibacter terrae]
MAIRISLAATLLAALALAACSDAAPAGRTAATRTGAAPAPSGVAAAQSSRLEALRTSIGHETQAYNIAIGLITDRLQAGTTPTNPELVALWNEAQTHLDKITADLGRLNALATEVARPAVSSTAPGRAGAPTADTGRMAQGRLAAEINSEIARQNSFLAAERPRLANLGYAVRVGRLGTVRTAG